MIEEINSVKQKATAPEKDKKKKSKKGKKTTKK
jgi:hypothetical protein